MKRITVLNEKITIRKRFEDEYISLTDIARYKNKDEPKDVVKNWLRNKHTIEFLGLWEQINNVDFKGVEFDPFLINAGSNAFVLSPSKWIKRTGAIGLITTSGRNGGTFAHKDIAIEFASWISVKFKLFLIKEFQRLKIKESKEENIEWDVKRYLVKINYKIHTSAIKQHLIPKELNKNQIDKIYANEADILNMALFGKTAKKWKKQNLARNKNENLRDSANISQLICLSNLESLNAYFIDKNISQSTRLKELNAIAISQMKILTMDHFNIKRKKIK